MWISVVHLHTLPQLVLWTASSRHDHIPKVWGCVGFGFPHRLVIPGPVVPRTHSLGTVGKVLHIAFSLVSDRHVTRPCWCGCARRQVIISVTSTIRVMHHDVYHRLVSRHIVVCCGNSVFGIWLHFGVPSLSLHTTWDRRLSLFLCNIVKLI